MKWPMPSGWQFIVYGSFIVALVCIVHSVDEIRLESLLKLDRIPLLLPETLQYHSINESIAGNTPPNSTIPATTTTETPKKPRQKIEIPLNCTFGVHLTCPANYYPTSFPTQDDQDVVDRPPPTTCPDYFRWIHEDLRPWKETGITRDMVESAWIESNFRVVILDGRAYMQRHKKGHTSRELFTLWGILQLLRRYPGKLPDVDLMFSIADQSAIKVADYSGPNATTAPPPLFRYCGTDNTLEIVFPDWSFWGWADLHIKSWEGFLEELKGQDKRWMDKEAYAQWKGTPLSPDRRDLFKCNISDKQDWGARLYKLNLTGRCGVPSARRRIERGCTRMRSINSSESTSFGVELVELAEVEVAVAVDLADHATVLDGLGLEEFASRNCPSRTSRTVGDAATKDWNKEIQEGFKDTDLASQCMHRYKIYVEGRGWSVSEKNILACNSVTLLVKPRYYDFFTRGLIPMHHYWPINNDDKCRSIKFAVEWGNTHEQEAKDIVKSASDFVHEDLKMDYVYDYMFHVLSEYSKLMRYKPTIPEKAWEICSETLACKAIELHKKYLIESMVKGPTDVRPCNMPPPYDPHAFRTLLRSKANSVSLVELWEQRYWENQTIHN
ncbi:hypothetical protein RHSIM_Rhsim03G0183700 [Rhododendron simsii]|uniref:Glycosyl transferase CAP10 domain-containing protein n=1 Tax=Rhododendron simsii TaxID=118357 RepID=A0A834HFP6_RHOSS|nr:hypothetical protein RHSIM_Rhsim03G0183700 [Rhododendron simsii]